MDQGLYYDWDCWYISDPESQLFHVFRLFAEQRHKAVGQHDKHSRLAYATSTNLTDFSDPRRDIVEPSADSSIWTGCTIRRRDGCYQLFYTERTTKPGYWAGQSIRCAVTDDLGRGAWRRQLMRLTPDSLDLEGQRFLRKPRPGDRTVHAWRDPFMFGHQEQIYMLVSAKSARINDSRSACIALLRARDEALLQWELVNEALVSGYEELEVPQLYLDAKSHEAVLVASTWDEQDYEKSAEMGYNPYRNEPNTSVRENGYLLAFRASDIEAALSGEFRPAEIALSPSDRIYAGVVVPERGGAVIGFEVGTGHHRFLQGRLPGLLYPDPSLKLVVPSTA